MLSLTDKLNVRYVNTAFSFFYTTGPDTARSNDLANSFSFCWFDSFFIVKDNILVIVFQGSSKMEMEFKIGRN